MPSRRLRISNKDLEVLEDKVTKQLLSKIETIVAKKCKELFEDNSCKVSNEPVAIQHEIESLKSSLISLKNDFKFLNNKADSTIGSLSFIVSEYHDFREKIGSITMGVFYGCSRCSVNTQHSLQSTDVIINQYAFCSTFITIFIWHIVSVLFSLHFQNK